VCQTNKVIEIADRLERIEAPGLIARKLFVKIFKSQDVSRGLSSVVCPHRQRVEPLCQRQNPNPRSNQFNCLKYLLFHVLLIVEYR
jgi:hypothetical protein